MLGEVAAGLETGSWGAGGNFHPLAYGSSGPLAGAHLGPLNVHLDPLGAHLGR